MELNNDLVKKLKKFEYDLRERRAAAAVLYDSLKGQAEHAAQRAKIVEDVKLLDSIIVEIRDAVKEARESVDDKAIAKANKNLERLANNYDIAYEKEINLPEPPAEKVESSEKPEKKKHTVRNVICGVLASAILFGVAYGLGSKSKTKTKNETAQEIVIDESELEVMPTPTENVGTFTDVNDEEQLRKRAQEYYDTYLNSNNRANGTANAITIDQLMNDMRVINGEFMLDGENPTYNDVDVIEVAKDLHTIAAYDSFKQYGNKILFTPMAPLFEDGTLAQKGAADLDIAMKKVVDAINKDDKEAFISAAQNWGTLVVNMFDYIDFSGEYVNIRQVDAPTAFQLFHAMNSKYASTILEYSEDNKLNVCIDYCTDYETGEVKQEALSQIMYNLNERCIDAVAVRSGNLAEYEANNVSLPEDLCISAKEYFNSKYNLEIGSSRSLK